MWWHLHPLNLERKSFVSQFYYINIIFPFILINFITFSFKVTKLNLTIFLSTFPYVRPSHSSTIVSLEKDLNTSKIGSGDLLWCLLIRLSRHSDWNSASRTVFGVFELQGVGGRSPFQPALEFVLEYGVNHHYIHFLNYRKCVGCVKYVCEIGWK